MSMADGYVPRISRGDGERELGVLLAHCCCSSSDEIRLQAVRRELANAVLVLDMGELENGRAHARAALSSLRAMWAAAAEGQERDELQMFGEHLSAVLADLDQIPPAV